MALSNYISETMNDKIKSALGGGDVIPQKVSESSANQQDNASYNNDSSNDQKKVRHIVTTEDELEAFFIIKNILKHIVPMTDITYKDTESYFNILYKSNSRKWICRLKLSESQMTLMIPDANKNITKYQLDDLYDLSKYRPQLEEVLQRYL